MAIPLADNFGTWYSQRKENSNGAQHEEMINKPQNSTRVVTVWSRSKTDLITRGKSMQSKLYHIRPTGNKGLGIFAIDDIDRGMQIMCEEPIMHVNNRTEIRAAYDALSPKRKRQFLYLHGYERRENKTGDKFTNKLLAIYATNGFWLDMWPKARTGIFNLSSRINHSCVPNATYRWCRYSEGLIITAKQKILRGEQITIDYGHSVGKLKYYYGFVCDCGACTPNGSSFEEVSECQLTEYSAPKTDEGFW